MEVLESYPKSGLFKIDDETENKLKNGLGTIHFKEIFLLHLSPEFLKLFKQNSKLFYSQYFLEGICYEYGLLDKPMNKNEAFKIYKKAADENYDYMCMYRLHIIFLIDYKDFDLQRNVDLDRLYLYKCLAYLPFVLINGSFFILNKINLLYEIGIYNDLNIFDSFIIFLKENNHKFHLTTSDIDLMNYVYKSCFEGNKIIENNQSLKVFLNIEKGTQTYYEAQLKYCNFSLQYLGEKCNKKEMKLIFDSLIASGYYKAALDYGYFLIDEGKNDEAKKIIKIGMDNSQQFCLLEYTNILLREYNKNEIMSDYNICTSILNQMLLVICIDKLIASRAFYFFYYLTKHTSFKNQLKNYIIEIYDNKEKYTYQDHLQSLLNNFSHNFAVEIQEIFGEFRYYGIIDNKTQDKENALSNLIVAYKA